MTDPPPLASKKSDERAARNARLAKALRENLRRRKEQARAREQRATEPPETSAPERREGTGEPTA
jgi:hypothetical protein